MVKASIEVVKNVDGRVESGVVIVQGKKLRFNNVWDDSGLLRRIDFDGRTVPTMAELYWFMNEKFIESIRNIGNIGNIEHAKVELVDVVTAINNVKTGEISPNVFINGDFETGDLTGWYESDVGGSISTSQKYYGGSYSYKLPNIGLGDVSIQQHISPCLGTELKILFAGWSDVNNGTIDIKVTFSDATTETVTKTCTWLQSWYIFLVEFATSKRIVFIEFTNSENNTVKHIDAIKGFVFERPIVSATDLDIRDLTSASDSVEAKQATRTNLLNKPEREDLLCINADLATNAAPQAVLAAVASQYHKVFGWDYYCDAAGTFEFQATIGGATRKFARRKTAGVHAMTLVHPIVCDVNTALNFLSNGGNTYYSLRYKTEA